MAQSQAVKGYNTFVKGLITESNPLTFPENSSIDEANFVLNRDGSRERRLGMDYEESYTLSSNISTTYFQDLAVTCHEWNNVANSGLIHFGVVQVGATLHFYDITKTNPSAYKKSFTVDLNTFATAFATNIGSEPVQVVGGKGYLFVVSKDTDPFYISHNPTADTIASTEITVQIRDFLGVDDGMAVDTRPATLSNEHKYNIQNQGWSDTQYNAYFAAIGVYPSNTQVWVDGKDTSDVFTPSLLDKQYFGNSPAPKGHYIIDAFTRDRATTSGIVGLTTELEERRPTTVAFYAGRVFYAGIESKTNAGPTLNGNVYYSQILEDVGKAGKCYQEADPTAEDISDLIDTDGGVVTIPEVGRIIKLEVMGNSLIVIASNGVWQVNGGTDTGFTATNYQVNKVTNVGALSASTCVLVEGSIMYWADGGIYVLQGDQTTGYLTAQNITQTTIQSLYLDINSVAKQHAIGNYDRTVKQISWLYNNDSGFTGATYKNKYNKELIYDLVLGAFYPHTISSLSSNSPYVAGYLNTPDIFSTVVPYNVVVGGVQVEVGAGNNVQVSLDQLTRGSLVSTKYLTVVPQAGGASSKLTFSSYKSTAFKDWVVADGTGANYSSFLITGYELAGDIIRDKQIVYFVPHFGRTETGYTGTSPNLTLLNPSGCYVQTRWNFSDSAASGQWSTAFQAYRLNWLYVPTGSGDPFDYGYSVVSTKNRIRGRGKAVSFNIYSEAGKDMHLLGWGVDYSGRTTV